MREGWQIKTIAETTKIVSGGTPKTKIEEYWSGDIAWITPADLGKLNTREVNLTRRTITEEGLRKSSAKLFPANSVILSSRAPIGHLAINTISMATNQGCRGIVPNNNLDNVFLFYFLKSNIKLLNELGTGTTFKELSTKALGSVKIPIPPLEEQKQIVAILDKAFTAIDQAKTNIDKNIVNAKELFQSKLNDIFSQKGDGWEEKTLGEVVNIIGGGTPSKKNEAFYDGDIPWATVRDMNSDKLSITDHRISELGLKKSSTNIIPRAHVIISTRVGLGKVCILEQDTAINQDLKGLIPKMKHNILNDFIFWWYKSIGKKVIEAGTGATVQGVKLSFVRELNFPLTTMDEQVRVVGVLNKFSNFIDGLEKQYLQKELDLLELKKSILQKAFAGELTQKEVVV
jgi:type I restriction enzyme S subunit